MTKISVIVPVYNESLCIEKTLEQVLLFSRAYPQFYFIFVNDGSSDATETIIKNTINSSLNNEQIRLISYEKNSGKGYAVRIGVKYAEGDCVCFIDADLAYSLEHLHALVEQLKDFDVVIGSRPLNDKAVTNQNIVRKLSGKVFNWLSRKILNLEFVDMQAGLKGFRLPVAKHIFQKQVMTGFSFDVELIYIARKYGYSISEIPAKVAETHLLKKSKVNIIKDSGIMFYNLVQIRVNDLKGRYE